MNPRLNSIWWAFRIGLGLAPFLAGLDKFFNILTDWNMYLSPLAASLLPISGFAFLKVVGVIEMGVGILILAGYTRWGGYIAGAWLMAIALNLVTTGAFFDVAVRDLLIALEAFALARLSEARETADSRGRAANSLEHARARAS